MHKTLTTCMDAVRCGEPVLWSNLALVPLFAEDRAPEYITLAEALEQQALRIVEISESGSVPELKVINTGAHAVLILDGEEIVGAKQNRVVNTSLLVAGFSELVVPVSCTEQGRWHHVSSEFKDSHAVLERQIRANKSQAVSCSLSDSGSFAGDQGQVWNNIHQLHKDLGTASSTMAMKDAYDARKTDLVEGLAALGRAEGQMGFIAVVNGRAAGMDFVSRAAAYPLLHERLAKSYLVDALRQSTTTPAAAKVAAEEAAAFLEEVRQLDGTEHPSPGLGCDVRLQSPRLVGSSLECDHTVVHLACFRMEEEGREAGKPGGAIRSMHHRRRYRTE